MRHTVILRAHLETRIAVLAHIVEIDALASGRLPVDVVLETLRVGPLEVFFLIAHARGQTPEDFIVRDGFARRLRALRIVREIEMSPRQDHVFHLCAHGGRQNDVSIGRRI